MRVKAEDDSSMSSLNETVGGEDSVHRCASCGVEATSYANLQDHLKTVHPNDCMECKLCGDMVLKLSFPDHVKHVHGFDLRGERPRGKSKMGEDGVQALCKVELGDADPSAHAFNIEFKGIDCCFCKQSYSNEHNLKKHMYNVHRMQRVRCDVCNKEVNKKSLDRHMKSVHSARVALKRERRSVPDEQKIPCYLCPKKCVSLMSLHAHIKNIHEAAQFKCSQCEFSGTKRGLERHMKKEHNEEVFQCTCCNKVLKSKSTLKEHMWIHTDHRRFICDICGMRFKRTSNYHGHMKSHQEKKFQCQLCGNFFLRKRYLAVHEQTIHDFYGKGVAPQEKGYQCEVCGVKLKWKNNLMAHMRIHTGEKPYKCKICGDDFTCHGSLRTHMSKHGE